MSTLSDLIARITDKKLRENIYQEVEHLSKNKKFGLVFEQHLPERTILYDLPIRRGCKVIPRNGKAKNIFVVEKISGEVAFCVDTQTHEKTEHAINSLVPIAEFGEPIYPYLKHLGTICNAPDSSLWHTLIEADNYHALQLLGYLYAGKVDCIYIDPPYNTGARNWKYNNNYVDYTDSYRHSKWLSMMEKRLRLAKRLLNPKESVLIVTIDEKEYLHLGCLLEELFPEARMQMVTTRINKKGSTRTGQFARCDEYIFFLMFGSCRIQKTKYSMLDVMDNSNPNAIESKNNAIWHSMLRGGANGSSRPESPNLFYPVWVDEKKKKIEFVGNPLPLELDRHKVESSPPQPGLRAVWPIRTDGSEGRWQLGWETLNGYLKQGIAKLGAYNKKRDQWAILYLKKKQREQLESGIILSKGRDSSGALILEFDQSCVLDQEPKTMWVRDWHDASTYGTNLLSKIILNSNFAFPKSLYAVHDAIRFFVASKPNALIVDFFAGSGTTLHAVNLLNAEDGGNRRCILVTNNEVSEKEAKELSSLGYHPGDKEWEKYGIARCVTWSRTVCSIKGVDIKGNPLKGNYLGAERLLADGFKANAIYFKLGFLDKDNVALGMQFAELLPILWMKTGAIGKCPKTESTVVPSMLILPENHFAVLADETQFSDFTQKLDMFSEIKYVYVVTDSETVYKTVAMRLQGRNVFQLYRDYLDNFRINTAEQQQ